MVINEWKEINLDDIIKIIGIGLIALIIIIVIKQYRPEFASFEKCTFLPL